MQKDIFITFDILQKVYMQFKDIPSNNKTKQQLLKSIHNGRLSHAHLFLGNDGSASLALAWAFAQYILCASTDEQDSCGQCHACLKCDKLNHPDFHWVFPVLSGQYKNPTSDDFLADWRVLLKNNFYPSEEDWYLHLGKNNKQGFISVHEANELSKKTMLKPFEGSYRVIIMWHCEKMGDATANKLLKLLEEPPRKTIFILLTNNSEDLPATIVSRLQIMKIEPADESSLSDFLQEKYNIEKGLAEEPAKISGAYIGKAIYDSIPVDKTYAGLDVDNGRMTSVVINEKSNTKKLLAYNLHFSSDRNLDATDHPDQFKSDCMLVMEGLDDIFIKNFAPFINQNNAIEIIEELESAHNHIAKNGKPKIIFMDLTLKICILLKVKNIHLKSSSN